MTPWIVASWIVLTVLVCLFIFAADGGRLRTGLDRHANSRTHRQQMAKAALCIEVAEHWADLVVTERFVAQAYRLCDDCGCPADCWPSSVVRLYVGVAS